jgi:hypothetical protein
VATSSAAHDGSIRRDDGAPLQLPFRRRILDLPVPAPETTLTMLPVVDRIERGVRQRPPGPNLLPGNPHPSFPADGDQQLGITWKVTAGHPPEGAP